ncbi:hypothetical protein [Heyndrickxia sporothermodurans]|nr:hypothetical protein [Heyndrickxia sporothermodurans]
MVSPDKSFDLVGELGADAGQEEKELDIKLLFDFNKFFNPDYGYGKLDIK